MNADKTGIVVFGHGSGIASANDAVRVVAAAAAREGGWTLYETAFLECDPKLGAAVERLALAGAEEVLVLPYFLTLGIHLQRDLPVLVKELAGRHGIAIRVAPPLDGHPGLGKMLVDRARDEMR